MTEIKFRVRSGITNGTVGYECIFPVEPDNSRWEWAQSVNGIDWTSGIVQGATLQREQFTGLKEDREGDLRGGYCAISLVRQWRIVEEVFQVFFDDAVACFKKCARGKREFWRGNSIGPPTIYWSHRQHLRES